MVRRFRMRRGRFARRTRRRRMTSSTMRLRSLNSRIQRAISERSYREAQGIVLSTVQAQSAFPIIMDTVATYFDAVHCANILNDTGVGGVALGSSVAQNDRYSMYKLSAKHQFRNAALNPVFLDVWVVTHRPSTGYESATDTNTNTPQEMLMTDLYQGWQTRYLAADLSAQVKTDDATTAWTVTGSGPMCFSSMNFTPETSQDFRRRWRVAKKHSVMLNPGQTFVLTDKAKPLFNWMPNDDRSIYTFGKSGTLRILLYRLRGALGYNGDSQGYCLVNTVYQGNYFAKVCKENSLSYLTATTAADLPDNLPVSGVGDDAVVS